MSLLLEVIKYFFMFRIGFGSLKERALREVEREKEKGNRQKSMMLLNIFERRVRMPTGLGRKHIATSVRGYFVLNVML